MSPIVRPPKLILVGGPNGAGKSTLTRDSYFGVPVIDPDRIAREFNPREWSAAALAAGREAIRLQNAYIAAGQSFARETTLAGNSPLRLLTQARQAGYTIELLYVGLENRKLSRYRVNARVAVGGHDIPTDDMQRRFGRSMTNLANAITLADSGVVHDNSYDRMKIVGFVRSGKLERPAADAAEWLLAANLAFDEISPEDFSERVRLRYEEVALRRKAKQATE